MIYWYRILVLVCIVYFIFDVYVFFDKCVFIVYFYIFFFWVLVNCESILIGCKLNLIIIIIMRYKKNNKKLVIF